MSSRNLSCAEKSPANIWPSAQIICCEYYNNAVGSCLISSFYLMYSLQVMDRYFQASYPFLFGQFIFCLYFLITNSTGQWSEPNTSVWIFALSSSSFKLSLTREFDTSKLKRIPQSLETGLFFVKFLFLLYSNI